MSESQSVPALKAALIGAEDKAYEKVAELSFMRTLVTLPLFYVSHSRVRHAARFS